MLVMYALDVQMILIVQDTLGKLVVIKQTETVFNVLIIATVPPQYLSVLLMCAQRARMILIAQDILELPSAGPQVDIALNALIAVNVPPENPNVYLMYVLDVHKVLNVH